MKSNTTLLLLAAGIFTHVQAGETVILPADKDTTAAVEHVDEKSTYDKIWDTMVLYKNPDNAYLQELRFCGRQQNEWFFFKYQKTEDSDWINRRTRAGIQAKFLKEFTFHVEADLDLQDRDPFYNKLTDAYIKWSPSKEFNITAGKHGTKFTLDGSTSSTQLITIDRSQIANNLWFPEEYIPGVSFSGEIGNWIYRAGCYSSGEASREFGDFDAGWFGLASLGYDFADILGVDKAILRADYVYQADDPGNSLGAPAGYTRKFRQVGSLNFTLEEGRYGLGTDLVTSRGYEGQPNVFGIQFMPSMYFNESRTFQGVFRYTYLDSEGNNGIRFARYENRLIGSARGDEYNEFYAGLNWYLYGHKLKFQTGVQYSMMEDEANDGGEYDGWGVTTGVRVSW
jgi:phosphate-selective porin OprO and OprP